MKEEQIKKEWYLELKHWDTNEQCFKYEYQLIKLRKSEGIVFKLIFWLFGLKTHKIEIIPNEYE